MKNRYSIFWMRRDLRLNDNAALHHAIQSGNQVICLFIFDHDILKQLENKNDARVNFIHKRLQIINEQLHKLGSCLLVKYGTSVSVMKGLLKDYHIANICANKDYEDFAIGRDSKIDKLLQSQGIAFQLYKDQVIFEKKEIVKKDGQPYTIYTPYMKKWKEMFHECLVEEYTIDLKKENFAQIAYQEIPSLESMGFRHSPILVPEYDLSEAMLTQYDFKRNFPAQNATSKLGPHLRFGTLSIREAVRKSLSGHPQFLNELIWREFFMQILANYPKVTTLCFNSKYENILWRNNEDDFERWCQGNTGYPLVDAGMRELKSTGNMHNRVRMVVASFLCKHLLIDWRWGEAWFANHLLDYELASNNGNWQWAAGCGCDAVPYFRIFNPSEQQKKFDPNMEYIRKWIPEIGTVNYPEPMVDHKIARQRALDTYKAAFTSYK